MIHVERKLCAGCGEPNLETDVQCWACGGFRFVPENAKLAGEPTIYLGEALDRTHAWEWEKPAWLPVVYLAVAAVFALFMCVVGFWIGRSSAPETQVVQSPSLGSQSVILPTPPTALTSPAPLATIAPASLGGPGSMKAPDPTVQVRTVPSATPRAAAASPAVAGVPLGQKPGVSPSTVVSAPFSPGQTSRVTTVYNYIQDQNPTAPPGAQPRVPAPTPKTAVVSLRNDSGATIEISFDGAESRTARVSAGSTVPLVLQPGSYQVRVTGGSASSARASAVLTEGRTYSLTVDGQKEEGATRLVIIEPAIDGVGG
jgi:hypothetical protein